jgi:hypothetical protein
MIAGLAGDHVRSRDVGVDVDAAATGADRATRWTLRARYVLVLP